MADVLDRARAALEDWRRCQVHGISPPYPAALLAGLVVELETARTQLKKARAPLNPTGINGQDNRVWHIPGFYVEQEFNGDVVINDRLAICGDELPTLAAALVAAANSAGVDNA